jgi:hypothetical protein
VNVSWREVVERLPRFIVRLFAWYLAFTLPWPLVENAYAWAFRACGNALFARFGDDQWARFVPAEEQTGFADTTIRFGYHRMKGEWQFYFSPRTLAFVPTATTAALVFATPAGWRRRTTMLVAALILVHGFITLRIVVVLYTGFAAGSPGRLPEWWTATLSFLWEALCGSTAGCSLVPVVTWLVVLGIAYMHGDPLPQDPQAARARRAERLQNEPA